MALTNTEFADAFAAALNDFHTDVTNEAQFAAASLALYDQWVLGGASVATAARQSAEAIAGLNTFLEQAIDWYAGTAVGGPDSDGLYPLTDSAGNEYSVPSPAKLIADLGGITPKGHVADVGSLPGAGNAVGDYYTVAGVGALPNRIYGWGTEASWVDLGEFQGDQGDQGDAATIAVGTTTTGDADTDAEVANSGDENDAVFDFTIPRGDPGADAEEISIQATATHIQWRRGEGAWANIVSLDSLADDGEEVELRVEGANIEWRLGTGSWATLIALSALIGPDGPAIELQTTGTHIQWRVVGDVSWINLVALDTLADDGVDGEEVELRVEGANIEWRLGTGSWVTLIATAALIGPPGDGFVPSGAWDVATSYDTGEAVSHSGASYASLVDSNLAVEPDVTVGWETSWMVIADPGDAVPGVISQADAEAGTATDEKIITALRLRQSADAAVKTVRNTFRMKG